MEKDFLPELSGDGVIRERDLSPEEFEAVQKQERDREFARRESSISARICRVISQDMSVTTKAEPPFKHELL